MVTIIEVKHLCISNKDVFNAFSSIMEEWITRHWAGGINIPSDFVNMSLEDKLDAIAVAQDDGEYDKKADLYVELYKGRIAKLKWVSGSQRGALYATGNIYPCILCIDAGTSEDFSMLIEESRCHKIKVATIRIETPNSPFIELDMLDTLALMASVA